MRKRGLVLIVLMLIIASSVVAIDWVDAPRLNSLYVYLLNEKGCSYDTVGDDEIPADGDYINARSEVGAYCSLRTDGCVVEVRREEKAPCGTFNGCFDFHYCLSVKKGIKLDNTYSENIFRNNNLNWFGDFKEDPDGDSDCSPNECAGCSIASSLDEQDCGDIGCANIKSPVAGELLCGEDSLWARCIQEDASKITRVGDKIYNCTYENLQAKWVALPGVDKDKDGYTNQTGDCADNPNAPGLQTIGCPEAPDGCDENTKKCAVCINPDAPEVCGDGIGNGTDNDPTEGKGNDCNTGTSDDCDKNQWACEQRADPTAGESAPIQTNVFGTLATFSWINTAEGGHCCGFHGAEDVGTVWKEPTLGEFLCLYKDQNLVETEKTEAGVDGLDAAFGTAPEGTCTGPWCMISATNPANQFKVFTINKLDGVSQDIVSNGVEWKFCDNSLLGQKLSPPGDRGSVSGYDDLRTLGNRFQCYKEGSNRWSWAECPKDYAARENKGVKGRYAGEGVYSLPLTQDETTPESKTGKSIEIAIENYLPFYKNNPELDFSGYDTLNFMVAFTKEDGSRLDANTPLNIPANIFLEIIGPMVGDQSLIYFSDSVLGYAVNNPTLPGDDFLHIQVPLGNFAGVKRLIFRSEPETNFITVKNVYLSNGAQTNLCSAAESREMSAWISDMDYNDHTQRTVTGEFICKALYGDDAWIGNDDQVTSESARCCGDDPNEFYAGPSAFGFGCWNSVPIKSGDTTMSVQFNVSYLKKESAVEYPLVDFGLRIGYRKYTTERVDVDWKCPTVNENSEQLPGCPPPNQFCIGCPECSVTSNTCDGQESVPSDTCSVTYTIKDGIVVDYKTKLYTCGLTTPPPELAASLAEIPPDTGSDTWCITGKDECYTQYEIMGTAYSTELSDALYQKFPQILGPVHIKRSSLQSPLNEEYKGNYTLTKKEAAISIPLMGTVSIPTFDPVSISFFDPLNPSIWEGKTVLVADDLPQEENEVYIKVALNENYQITVTPNLTPVHDEIRTYSCNQDECLYPVPGWMPSFDLEFFNWIGSQLLHDLDTTPSTFSVQSVTRLDRITHLLAGLRLSEDTPLIISNLHPELYELYYVSGPGEEVLITSTPRSFNFPGNLKVKKLAQQVLYYDPGVESIEVPAFYGCQAADYLVGNDKIDPTDNNLLICSIKSGYFCSPSALIKKSAERDYYTAINTWSSEKLKMYGYAPFLDAQPGSVEEIQLKLNSVDEYYPPSEASVFYIENYTHLTSSFPTQNFVPNAEFILKTREGFPYWKILDNQGQELTTYSGIVQGGAVKLAPHMKLISERIAIPLTALTIPTTNLSFNDSGNCDFEISQYNNNGDLVPGPITERTRFEGLGNFVVISYHNYGDAECQVKLPNLQVVDAQGPSNTSYKSQQSTLNNYDFRAGQACCPQNWCWNGYTCVEPMGPFSKRAEHTPDGRDYRCIKGVWSALPPKMDWKNLDWGFCQRQDQCYVISAEDDANRATTNVTEFTKQLLANRAPTFPSCINNGEYILDNYCENGTWTSRTKYLAAKLLDFAKDNLPYSLYCADIDLALGSKAVEENIKELAGEGTPAEPRASPVTQGSSVDQLNVEQTCFDALLTGPSVSPTNSGPNNLLVTHKQNKCVNNICILKYGDGKTAVATTLNKPVDSEDSFLKTLNIPLEKILTACNVTSTGPWRECDVDQGSLWYWEDYGAVIYDPEGITIQPGPITAALNYFISLVTSLFRADTENNQVLFLKSAQNYNTVFMFDNDQKQIRAVKENIGGNQTISAEFENFEMDICKYADGDKVNVTNLKSEVLEAAAERERLFCDNPDGESIQTIKATAPSGDDALDLFWPQLTGMLRVAQNEE